MSRYFLTVDNGGTNTKVGIFDQKGTQIAVRAFPTPGEEPSSGFHEINLANLWSSISKNIKLALNDARLKGDQISGISTVGHGKGLYALDQEGKPFTRGILSADSRAEKYAEQFNRDVSQIFQYSHQQVMPSQAPVILKWLKDNRPDEYRKIGWVLSNKDFVGYLLTGEVKQEIGDASGNNLVNLDDGKYDRRLFEFFGIPEMYDKMPPLIWATDERGRVSRQVAEETGLREGTPVFGGMFDIDACSIATGVLDDSRFSVIAGTWNINVFPSSKMASLESGLMNSIFPTKKWLIEASSPTSAGNLAIAIKMLMTAEARDAKDAGKNIYDDLEVFLEQTDARFSKVVFFPFLYGSNNDPNAEGAFIGIRSNTTKSELIRAVYEGIAFAHRDHIDRLTKALGHKPDSIRMSGGATNSPSWVQMFANILGIPVELVNANELGGLGGAITSAVGAGEYSSLEDAVSNMSRVISRVDPEPEQVALYNKKYLAYSRMLAALQGGWSDLRLMQEGMEDQL